MWTRRIKDIIAMLLIGDGALTLIGAQPCPGVALRARGATQVPELAS